MGVEEQRSRVDVSTELVGSVFKATVQHWPSGKWLMMEGDVEDGGWLVRTATEALRARVAEEALDRLGW